METKKNEYFMTREQVGRALEYQTDPANAIAKIHHRHSDRLDKFSGVVRLSTPSGTQETTVYNRKGIMEICRWSQQPKADIFMDWVWEVMDALITGKTKIISAQPKLGEVNSAARLIDRTLKEAGMSPQFRAVALKNLYAPVGINVPMNGIKLDKQFYDATAIATRVGIISKTGKPHNQAVASIIAKLNISDDEKTLVPFQNQASGHSGPTWQYSESVIGKITVWLNEHNYPLEIVGVSKTYNVIYSKKSENVA